MLSFSQLGVQEPRINEMALQKCTVLSPTPLIKGVNLHPLNEGGMGCQGRGSCDNTLLRRVLRRRLAAIFEGGRALSRVPRRGSKKGLLRRYLESKNTDFDLIRPNFTPKLGNEKAH